MSTTKKLFWIGILLFSVALILIFLNKRMSLFDDIQNLALFFVCLGAIPFLSSYFYQYFDYEKIDFKKDGHWEINEEAIILDHLNSIRYSDIMDIQFGLVAFYGERINLIYKNPIEQKSLGISNHITIVTNAKIYKFNFKLETEVQYKELEQTILDLVLSGKLDQVDSKRKIKLVPTRLKTTRAFKDYVVKQIQENKISCTEGLLLHGYNTDDEAAELRKKYCG